MLKREDIQNVQRSVSPELELRTNDLSHWKDVSFMNGGKKPNRGVLTQDPSPYDNPMIPPPLPMYNRPGQGNPAMTENIKGDWVAFFNMVRRKVSISSCLCIVYLRFLQLYL